MKIVVKKVDRAYQWQPTELDLEKLAQAVQLRNENINPDEDYILLITRTAQKDIFDFIHWGDHKTGINKVEQGGLLAGSYFFSPSSGKRICIVERAFPVDTAIGTPSYWEASAEDWHKTFAAMDRYSRETGRELFSLGWFHTHPNLLATFMSGTDRRTQMEVFNDEANFALVLNPHTGSWKAYRSRNVLDACCMMVAVDSVEDLLACTPDQERSALTQPGPKKNAQEELCEIEQEYEKQRKLLKQLEKRLKIAQKAAKKEKKIHKKKA